MYLLPRLQAGRISRSRTVTELWYCTDPSPRTPSHSVSETVSRSHQRVSENPPAPYTTLYDRSEFCAPATGQCSLTILATSQGVHNIGTKSPHVRDFDVPAIHRRRRR